MEQIPWKMEDVEYGLSLVRKTEESEAIFDLHTREMIAEREERMRRRETASLLWLAAVIGMKPSRLLWSVLGFRAGMFGYTTYAVSKRNGNGKRRIAAPHKVLRSLQRTIARELFTNRRRSPHSFGFLGGSAYDALVPHAKNASLLMVDVYDAFGSIERDTIFRWFEKYGFSWRISTLLADLVTFERKLPQGSPLSPRIFELMFEWIDERLSRLAKSVGGTYTRYADNIFFSVPRPRMDKILVGTVLKKIRRDDLEGVWSFERYHTGFSTHKLSVRTLPGNAVHALGLVLRDGSVHNTRDFKRTLRKRIHHVRYLLRNGFEAEVVMAAWSRLCSAFSYARRETLSSKLLRDVEDIRERIRQLK